MHWSRTQQLIALSSAEAELNAAIKAGQEGLSLRHLAEELGEQCWVQVLGHSSAADGMVKRSGKGKVKHLSVRQLWLQDKVGQGDLQHDKIPRLDNVADAMTHHFSKAEGAMHFGRMSCHRPRVPQADAGENKDALPEGGLGKATTVGVPACAFYSLVLLSQNR